MTTEADGTVEPLRPTSSSSSTARYNGNRPAPPLISTSPAQPFKNDDGISTSRSSPSFGTRDNRDGGVAGSQDVHSTLSPPDTPLSPNPLAGHPPPPSNAAIEQIIASAMALAGSAPPPPPPPPPPPSHHSAPPAHSSAPNSVNGAAHGGSGSAVDRIVQGLPKSSIPSTPPPIKTGPPPPLPSGAVIGAGVFNYPPNRAANILQFHPAAVGADGRVNLFVGNLPYRVRWQDVKDLFRRAGTVLRADVSLDAATNRSRGHGNVLMGSREDGIKAIEMFNGYNWQTRILEVRPDRLPPEYEPHPYVSAQQQAMARQQHPHMHLPYGPPSHMHPGALPNNFSSGYGPHYGMPPSIGGHMAHQNQYASASPHLSRALHTSPSSSSLRQFGEHTTVAAPSRPASATSPPTAQNAAASTTVGGSHQPSNASKDPWSDTASISPAVSTASPMRFDAQSQSQSQSTAPSLQSGMKRSISPIGGSAGSRAASIAASPPPQPAGVQTAQLQRASHHATFGDSGSGSTSAEEAIRALREIQDDPLGLRRASAVSMTSLTAASKASLEDQSDRAYTTGQSHTETSGQDQWAGEHPTGSTTTRNSNATAHPSYGNFAPPPQQHYDTIGARLLHVGNLPFQIQWQDLKDLFRGAGNVIRADIALGPDGRSKGHGTVLYASEADALEAVMRFDGTDFHGRKIQVRQDWQQRQSQPLPFPPTQLTPTSLYPPHHYHQPFSGGFAAFGPPSPSEMFGSTYSSGSNADRQSDTSPLQSSEQVGPPSNNGQSSSRVSPEVRKLSNGGGMERTPFGPAPGTRASMLRNSHPRPGRIILPTFPTFGPNQESAVSPIQTRALPPMTPSMPGFTFHAYPSTPPLHPMSLLSPGVGPYSPTMNSPATFGSFNPFMNPAPGAPVMLTPKVNGSDGRSQEDRRGSRLAKMPFSQPLDYFPAVPGRREPISEEATGSTKGQPTISSSAGDGETGDQPSSDVPLEQRLGGLNLKADSKSPPTGLGSVRASFNVHSRPDGLSAELLGERDRRASIHGPSWSND